MSSPRNLFRQLTESEFSANRLNGALSLVAIVLLAAVLRFIGIEQESLSGDEIHTAVMARRTLDEILFESLDHHPPLQFLLTKISVLVGGATEFFVRLPSILYGLLSIPLLYLIIARASNPKLGFAAALLFAVAPLSVWYSQEARPYMGSCAFSLGLSYLLLRFVDKREGRMQVILATLVGVVSFFGQYNHYYFSLLMVIMYGATGVILLKRNRYSAIVLLSVPALISLSAYLIRLDPFLHDLDETGLLVTLSPREGAEGLFRAFGLSRYLSEGNLLVALFVWVLSVVGGIRAIRSKRPAPIMIGLIAWAYPLGLLFGAVAFGVAIEIRQFVPAFPFWLFMVVYGAAGTATWISSAAPSTRPFVNASAVSLSIVALVAWSLTMWTIDLGEYTKDQWRDVVDYVVSGASPGDIVYIEPYSHTRHFEFYAGEKMTDFIGQNGSFPACSEGRRTWTVVRAFRQDGTASQLSRSCVVVEESLWFAGNFGVTAYDPNMNAEALLEIPLCDGHMPTIIGTLGDDDIRGTERADVIHAMEGDDHILASDGDDIVCGGDGDDLINAADGDDRVLAGDGDDDINSGEGRDIVFAGAGNDLVNAGGGSDWVSGDEGNDRLLSGDGDDELFGRSGSDTLNGGAGNDVIDGGSEDDNLNGGSGDDVLIGGEGADQINASDGDDQLIGGPGDDVLNGGDGDDSLMGDDGADTLNAGPGNDIADGGVGDDTLNGGDGDDDLQSGEGDDVINAGEGDDTLRNQAGADILRGGPGEDRCFTSGLEETLQCET